MIITTINQITAVLTNVAGDVEYDDFKPHIESAEYWIEKEILGSTIYGKIEDGSITDTKLLRLVHNIICLKGYEIGLPFMDLIQTQSGFGVINDKNRAPASKQRVDRLIEQNKIRLNAETEWLIDYLEDTATYHTDWKSSPAYSLLSDCLIMTARELKRYVNFEGSRADFLMLKPVLINLTTLKLHPMISRGYIAELISKQNAGTLNSYDNTVLPGLKQSLANYALDKDWIADRLLEDAVTIMDNDLDNYVTYRDSDEKALKDDPGYENTEEDKIFVFKGGM